MTAEPLDVKAVPRTFGAIEKSMAAGAAGAIVMLALGTYEVTGIAVGRSAPLRQMTTDTLVPWSCAGKPLLAAAMMPFVASGELPMDTPIHYWLPKFRRLHPDLTLRHVIMHKSGVNDGLGRADPGRPLHEVPPAPGFFPGKVFIYSSWWNWSVLSAVVETVTGKSAESAVRDGVLSPAGIRDSTFMTPDYLAGPDSHTVAGSAEADIMEFTTDAFATDRQTLQRMGLARRDPTTRICGPLSDLARFYRWIQDSLEHGNELLPVALVREATASDRVLGFCVGMKKFGFGRHCSPRSFGFGGALGGSNVVVGLAEPDHDFCLAVAVNRIGQESAIALKAIVTAMYEDVLD